LEWEIKDVCNGGVEREAVIVMQMAGKATLQI
jgi:hypothetical protein